MADDAMPAPLAWFDPGEIDPADLHLILIGARAAIAVDAFWRASVGFVEGIEDAAGIRVCDDATGWALATAERMMALEPGTLFGFVAVFANRPFDPYTWNETNRARAFDPIDAPAGVSEGACQIVEQIVGTEFDAWMLFPPYLDVGPAFNAWALGDS